MENVARWLHGHPWGWLLIVGGLLFAFIVWLAVPLTWRNAEGDIVREGNTTANFWESVLQILRWR